jgi:hypothetical protein
VALIFYLFTTHRTLSAIVPRTVAGPTSKCCLRTEASDHIFSATRRRLPLVYRRYGNRLFLPGTYSTESWEFGNLYVHKASGWKKYRTIPRGLHVFDSAEYAGRRQDDGRDRIRR